MHLVFLNQYYPPDVAPTGLMLEAVAECLVDKGHEVTVLCAEGGYGGGEKPDALGPDKPGMRVVRIRATGFGRGTAAGKLADYLTFYLGVVAKLATLQPKPDRVVALTTPPYLSVLARGMSKLRGADHAHWVMDLYPDVMVAHGMLTRGGGAHRVLAALGRWAFCGKRRAALLTLGPDMARRVAALAGDRGSAVSGDGVDWVPLWASTGSAADDHSSAPAARAAEASVELAAIGLRRRRGWADDEIVVMYSGNMGLGHRFQEFLAAARVLADPSRSMAGEGSRYRFVFYGRGKRRGEIEAFVRGNPGLRVELHDYAPAEELAAHLRSADLHLASLEGSWTGTMLPSKTQGVFAAGRPLLVVGAADSSMACWVQESGGGWVVTPGDDGSMLAALQEAAQSAERRKRGDAARNHSHRHFSRRENVTRCAAILSRPRTPFP